jgi:hypothetical protein
MPSGRFCVYMEPRANLARSPAPVPLTAASVSATRQHPTPKRRYTMKEINLREFYPWYMEDVMVEVTEEVAEELLAGQRYIKASRRRIYRNKAHYSLDAEDGIEYSACFSNPSPQELIERMERFEHICHALNSLPDAQGQRVFEHYLLNHSVKAIAAAEGVTERAINAAIQRGLENMKKYLEKVL